MSRVDVIIIGAGSTGLILAKQLELSGINVLIVEKRQERGTHSRAIGIHPPGLHILDEIGVLDKFITTGTSVYNGLAYVGPSKVGEIELASGTLPHDRVLTIPQYKTEELLENSLKHTKVLRGWTLSALNQHSMGVHIEITSGDKKEDLDCSVLLGADGMHSTVRNLIGVRWGGKTYPFKYAMADVSDNTGFSNRAAIFLSNDGLTESFPIPGGVRRWVVNHKNKHIDQDTFFEIIHRRTGILPNIQTLTMFSEFEIHRFRAKKMFVGNVFLAGDALGVMSPIGGQAMSLHWVQTKELVEFLERYLNQQMYGSDEMKHHHLNALQNKQLKRIRQYSDRSHFNTVMGLPGTPNWILKGISKVLLAPGMKNYWSKRFTMQDLMLD